MATQLGPPVPSETLTPAYLVICRLPPWQEQQEATVAQISLLALQITPGIQCQLCPERQVQALLDMHWCLDAHPQPVVCGPPYFPSAHAALVQPASWDIPFISFVWCCFPYLQSLARFWIQFLQWLLVPEPLSSLLHGLGCVPAHWMNVPSGPQPPGYITLAPSSSLCGLSTMEICLHNFIGQIIFAIEF